MDYLGLVIFGLILLGLLMVVVRSLLPRSEAEAAAESALAAAFFAFVEETRPLTPKAGEYPQAALYRHTWRRSVVLADIAAESNSDADIELFKRFQQLARREYYAVAPKGPYGKVRLVHSGSAKAKLHESELARIAAKARPATGTLRGVVYLLKSGVNYKVGRTTDMDRRLKEMKQQLPDPVTVEHKIRTNDPVKIENIGIIALPANANVASGSD